MTDLTIRCCPFCGGKVIREDDLPQHYFTCQGCNATTNIYSHAIETAIMHWNMRHNPCE